MVLMAMHILLALLLVATERTLGGKWRAATSINSHHATSVFVMSAVKSKPTLAVAE